MNLKNARILVGRPNLSSPGPRPRLFVMPKRDILDEFVLVYAAKTMINADNLSVQLIGTIFVFQANKHPRSEK